MLAITQLAPYLESQLGTLQLAYLIHLFLSVGSIIHLLGNALSQYALTQITLPMIRIYK